MILAILILIGVIIFFWQKKKFARHNYLLSKIPTLKKYPILYHIPYFYDKTPITFFSFCDELNKKLGDVYYICFGNVTKAFSVVADVQIVEELLTSNVEFDKTTDYEFLVPWIGRGLLISSDKKWFQRRKLLTPGFHFQILEKFVEVMNSTSDVLAKKLESYEGKEVNIFPVANLYALDTVCECTMAKKLNSQTEDSAYAKAVKEITSNVMTRSFDPIKNIEFFYRFTKSYQREKELIKFLHAFTNEIIESRREELLKLNTEDITKISEGKKKALLDILLTSTIEGAPLNNEDIREEVDTFLFAGHDTTTSALTFIFYNIAKYPEVQQKIYEEIIEVIANEEKVTLSKLNSLHYTELVIKESLRLFPSVPYYGRRLKEEFTAGGFTFPKGMSMIVSSYLMGRSEQYFDKPEEFNPERFNIETTYEKINPFAFVPFSAGPRNCIGQKFASLVLRSAIVKVVKKFKLCLGETYEDPPLLTLEIVLRPANGIFIKFEKR